MVVRQRVFKKSSGWRPVKSTVPHPSDWLHPPPPDRIVKTVPAAVELALSQGVGADGEGGGGRGGGREVGRLNGRVFVGRGLHEWKNARLIVGEWRADDTAPYQSVQERDAVGGKGVGGEGMMITQTVDLYVHAEDGSRIWGLWFMEPESGGSFDGVTCAYTTEGQEEILMDVWGRPWTFDSCQVRCAGGMAIRLAKLGEVTCSACGIGGLEGGTMNETTGEWEVEHEEFVSGHAARATFGVRVQDKGHFCATASCLEFTGLYAAAIHACDGSTVSVDTSHLKGNSVGILLERDSNVSVFNSWLKDNDMAAFAAGMFSHASTAVFLNNTIEGKVWINKCRPGHLEANNTLIPSPSGSLSNESKWEQIQRLQKRNSDGLDMSDGIDIDDFLYQGCLPEDESNEVRESIQQTKLGEFSTSYAWHLHEQDMYDPKIHKVGVNWPPPVDAEYLASDTFLRQQTVEGLTAAEHSFWRGAGYPAGEIPPSPFDMLEEDMAAEEEEEVEETIQ